MTKEKNAITKYLKRAQLLPEGLFDSLLGDAKEARLQFGKTAGRLLVGAATKLDPTLQDRIKTGTHDSLTGLLNKGAFMDQLEADMRSGKQLGVLFIDLNNFKQVNQELSHQVGDEILQKYADLLKRHVRDSDQLGYGGVSNDADDSYQIGRFGGDEFWVTVDLTDRDGVVNINAASEVAQRINDAFPEFIQGLPQSEKLSKLGFNAAVGVVDVDSGENMKTLIERASRAMQSSKLEQKRD